MGIKDKILGITKRVKCKDCANFELICGDTPYCKSAPLLEVGIEFDKYKICDKFIKRGK